MIRSIPGARALLPVLLLPLLLPSCSSRHPAELPHAMKASDHVEVTFIERNVPDHCDVFAHLIVTIPANLSAETIRDDIEQLATTHGADYLLLGLARQSRVTTDHLVAQPYGPHVPYSFKNSWTGWKFGFSDWNKGGPLVDFGINHLTGGTAPFTVPIDVQAVFLACPASVAGGN